jgi:hypothetical protein
MIVVVAEGLVIIIAFYDKTTNGEVMKHKYNNANNT